MSDKAATNKAKSGDGMSRDQLVRAHFDSYSDLTWKQHLEPKFDDYDVDADSMRGYRQQWNAYTEKRDWAWWVQNTAQMSTDELKAEMAKCHEEIAAIDMRRSARDPAQTQSAFQAILNGDSLGKDRLLELAPTRTKTREM
jgi:hypothetical protein